jgi:hypothetical protein
VGESVIDRGAGGMIALVAISREMFRTSRSNEGGMKSGQQAVTAQTVEMQRGGRMMMPTTAVPCQSSLWFSEVILGEGLTTNHGGRMSQTQNAWQREGMGMGKGWAGCLFGGENARK